MDGLTLSVNFCSWCS